MRLLRKIDESEVRIASITKPELDTTVWDEFYNILGAHPTDFDKRENNWYELFLFHFI